MAKSAARKAKQPRTGKREGSEADGSEGAGNEPAPNGGLPAAGAMDTDAAPKKRRKRDKSAQKTNKERVVEAYERARARVARRSGREDAKQGAEGAPEKPGSGQAPLSLPDAQTLLRRHEEVNRETEVRQGAAARRAKAAVNSMLLGPAADADRVPEGSEGGEGGEAAPAAEEAAQWGLHPALVAATRRSDIVHFFPIQRRVVPAVLRADARSATLGGDVCITAPTGSGKTLAYALPILHALASRRVIRLRALVLLPTRDLAQQVRRVFAQWAAGTDLRIGLAVGRSSLAREQANLVEPASDGLAQGGGPGPEPDAWSILREGFRPAAAEADGAEPARSRVDILIATPGRLADHLLHTPGFTLRHLRFLVADEADRLLADRYSSWIDRVHSAAYQDAAPSTQGLGAGPVPLATVRRRPDAPRGGDPHSIQRGSAPGAGSDDDDVALDGATLAALRAALPGTPLRRFLCSATLTRNPQKLAALALHNPMYFMARGELAAHGAGAGEEGKYAVPASLTEYIAECRGTSKPVVLLKLLAEAQARGQRALVFASSLAATHRVARILHLHGNPLKVEGLRTEAVAATGVSEAEAAAHAEKGWTAGEFSRALPQNQRNSMLSKLRAGAVNVLVCSDSAARGLDLPQVDVVINYDAPAHLKTYLHRVGRTARAGKAGTSYTLLRSDQMGFFKRMLRKADHNTVRRYKTKRMPWHLLAPRVRAALRELRNVLATETRSAMALYAPVEPLPADAGWEHVQEEEQGEGMDDRFLEQEEG